MIVELDLFGDHRFRLGDQLRRGGTEDAGDDLVGLCGVGREVHYPADLRDTIGEAVEEPIEIGEGVEPDGTGAVAQLLAPGKLIHNRGARGRHEAHAPVDGACLVTAEQGFRTAQKAHRLAHGCGGPSSSAMCLTLISEPRRRRPPSRCMRHETSDPTRVSAPEASSRSSFSSMMAAETGAISTENSPPNPQHSSAPSSGTRCTSRSKRSACPL